MRVLLAPLRRRRARTRAPLADAPGVRLASGRPFQLPESAPFPLPGQARGVGGQAFGAALERARVASGLVEEEEPARIGSQLFAAIGMAPGFGALGPKWKAVVVGSMLLGAWLAILGASGPSAEGDGALRPGMIASEWPLALRTQSEDAAPDAPGDRPPEIGGKDVEEKAATPPGAAATATATGNGPADAASSAGAAALPVTEGGGSASPDVEASFMPALAPAPGPASTPGTGPDGAVPFGAGASPIGFALIGGGAPARAAATPVTAAATPAVSPALSDATTVNADATTPAAPLLTPDQVQMVIGGGGQSTGGAMTDGTGAGTGGGGTADGGGGPGTADGTGYGGTGTGGSNAGSSDSGGSNSGGNGGGSPGDGGPGTGGGPSIPGDPGAPTGQQDDSVPIPEPGSFGALLAGIALAVACRRR